MGTSMTTATRQGVRAVHPDGDVEVRLRYSIPYWHKGVPPPPVLLLQPPPARTLHASAAHGTGAYVDDARGRRGAPSPGSTPRSSRARTAPTTGRCRPVSMSTVCWTTGVPRPSVTTYWSESTAAPRDAGMRTPAASDNGVTVRPEALLMMWLLRARSRRSLSAKDGSPPVDAEAGAHGPCRCASSTDAQFGSSEVTVN